MTQKRFIKLVMSYGQSRNEVRRVVDYMKRENNFRMKLNHEIKLAGLFREVPLIDYEIMFMARSFVITGGLNDKETIY